MRGCAGDLITIKLSDSRKGKKMKAGSRTTHSIKCKQMQQIIKTYHKSRVSAAGFQNMVLHNACCNLKTGPKVGFAMVCIF